MNEAQPFEHCPGGCHEKCVNGKWQDWSPWSPCSVTCGTDGKRSRNRTALPANHCGFPAEGPDTEYEGCNGATLTCPGHKDCTWTGWSVWQACSASCSGSRSRTREVQDHAALGGKPCHGGVLEMGRCNPDDGESTPPGCPAAGVLVDCEIADWSPWSDCSQSCEGGYKTRQRALLKTPMHGGKACDPNLKEVEACNSEPCTNKGQDCVLASWEEWSKCDAHTGARTRHREVAVKAIYGADCQGSLSEVEHCETDCKMSLMHYCVWSVWEDWSPCSRTCGPEGRMSRSRKLFATRESMSPK
jgi:hypothetical protein